MATIQKRSGILEELRQVFGDFMDMAFFYCFYCKLESCELRHNVYLCEDCEDYGVCNICCDKCKAGHNIAKESCYKPCNDWWEEYGYYEVDDEVDE